MRLLCSLCAVAGTSYTYAVGCGTVANSTSPYWSGSRSFRAPLPVGPNANLSVAVLADQGTIVPLGWAVADRVIADHQASPFDLTVLAGAPGCKSNQLHLATR